MRLKKIGQLLNLLAVAHGAFLIPATEAQTVHFAGAGSSAQFRTAALAADNMAYNLIAQPSSGTLCTFHWTARNAANLIDNRDNLNRIPPQNGNAWVVWVADCSDATGNTGVTDIWLDVSVDSAVAVRAFSAQQKAPNAGPGALVQVIPSPAGDLISPSTFWADGQPDVSLAANVSNAIGTSSTGTGDVHVNVALTDIRPEDALFATRRALAPLNTTNYAGLGYRGPTGQIGAPIYTSIAGSGNNVTPVGFALSGANDPINAGIPVPAYQTIPIGAAPLIFIVNNGGSSTFPTNLVSGIVPGKSGGSYELAHLFDSTTTCDTHNPAFGGNGDGLGTPLTVVVETPLSGGMNTAEFDAFRTTGNTSDSQEKGVINPTRAPYNPLNLPCAGGVGMRVRAIGTDEVVNVIKNTPNSIGYILFSWENISPLVQIGGAANRYLGSNGDFFGTNYHD